MARLGKSDKFKSGVYMHKRLGYLMTIEKPWLEQFYNPKTGELLQLDTAIISTEKVAPIYRVVINDKSSDLEYIGKL